jgi:hypothetical protein
MANINIREVKTIVTHEGCADGIASALIIACLLNTADVHGWTIKFVHYNTPEHEGLAAEPNTWFVDMSPPASRVDEFIGLNNVRVVDHHRTARLIVEAFGAGGLFGDEQLEPGVCGALLLWRSLRPQVVDLEYDGQPGLYSTEFIAFIDRFARLVGIRDTWQRQNPEWDKACVMAEVLRFFGYERLLTRGGLRFLFDNEVEMSELGQLLIDKHRERVAQAINRGMRAELAGRRVLLMPGIGVTSDAAEMLGDEVDLVVGFDCAYELDRWKYIYSLRSHTDFDCADFCKNNGGGGHTRAAGFSTIAGLESPMIVFTRRLIDHMKLVHQIEKEPEDRV